MNLSFQHRQRLSNALKKRLLEVHELLDCSVDEKIEVPVWETNLEMSNDDEEALRIIMVRWVPKILQHDFNGDDWDELLCLLIQIEPLAQQSPDLRFLDAWNVVYEVAIDCAEEHISSAFLSRYAETLNVRLSVWEAT